jgi:Ca-activated chloride channel family protein
VVAELAALVCFLLAGGAELVHARRTRKLAALAFGPGRRAAPWARIAPLLRVSSLAAIVWGLTTLFLLPPKTHRAVGGEIKEYRHVILALDVSPSMRLRDAGPTGEQSRMQRASDVMQSFFDRTPVEQYRLSVVAFYNGAKPVVVDTRDLEVVRNILGDLPMEYAFTSGDTDIFSGLEAAVEIARPWQPKSTTLILLGDGNTVPATGMPKLPASIAHVLVVGVGDPLTGSFINGRQSRQDVSTLRQIAARLRGTFHDANKKHLSTDLLNQLSASGRENRWEKLTRREYALVAAGVGGFSYALLPLLLHFFGTRWRPGVRIGQREGAEKSRRIKERSRVTEEHSRSHTAV